MRAVQRERIVAIDVAITCNLNLLPRPNLLLAYPTTKLSANLAKNSMRAVVTTACATIC